MVDPVTRWSEFLQFYIPPLVYFCQEILDSVWLSCYPRPKEIGIDNGGEHKKELTDLCITMGLIKKVSNKWNPQSNAILKHIHQVLGDSLQVFNLENKNINPNKDDPFGEYLNVVVYAICSA